MNVYARNFVRAKGTSTSYGAFQSPRRSPRAPRPPSRQLPYRYRRYLVYGRGALYGVVGRNPYVRLAKLAINVGEYYYEHQPETVREKWRDAYSLLMENAWAKQGKDQDEKWVYPEGTLCVSIRDSGVSYDDCGPEKGVRTTSRPTADCHTWHYRNQTLGPNNASGNFFTLGPKVAGIYGCQRYNYDVVIRYPRGRVVQADEVYRQARVDAPVMPLPATLPQTPRQGRTRRPMPMTYPEPIPVGDTGLPGHARFRRIAARLDLKRYQEPAIQYGYGGRYGSGTRSIVTHDNLPPRKKEKEDKMKISHGLAMKVFGGYTEFKDFTESVAQAVKLKNGRDCRSKNIYAAWACIVANRDKLDRTEATWNILENQMEDFLIGQFGQIGAKSVARAARAGYYRSPVGWQFGGNWTRTPQLQFKE